MRRCILSFTSLPVSLFANLPQHTKLEPRRETDQWAPQENQRATSPIRRLRLPAHLPPSLPNRKLRPSSRRFRIPPKSPTRILRRPSHRIRRPTSTIRVIASHWLATRTHPPKPTLYIYISLAPDHQHRLISRLPSPRRALPPPPPPRRSRSRSRFLLSSVGGG